MQEANSRSSRVDFFGRLLALVLLAVLLALAILVARFLSHLCLSRTLLFILGLVTILGRRSDKLAPTSTLVEEDSLIRSCSGQALDGDTTQKEEEEPDGDNDSEVSPDVGLIEMKGFGKVDTARELKRPRLSTSNGACLSDAIVSWSVGGKLRLDTLQLQSVELV
jgi:hypothetical protein